MQQWFLTGSPHHHWMPWKTWGVQRITEFIVCLLINHSQGCRQLLFLIKEEGWCECKRLRTPVLMPHLFSSKVHRVSPVRKKQVQLFQICKHQNEKRNINIYSTFFSSSLGDKIFFLLLLLLLQSDDRGYVRVFVCVCARACVCAFELSLYVFRWLDKREREREREWESERDWIEMILSFEVEKSKMTWDWTFYFYPKRN